MQGNYHLYQSARDGYRSYLQAYASYSLKKIYDVNQLDLTKVGKSFGLPVPPRVNLNVGGGKSAQKRKREPGYDEEDWEEIDAVDKESGDEGAREDEEQNSRRSMREQSRSRREETLGRKRLEKEVYRKGMERKKQKSEGTQWSR